MRFDVGPLLRQSAGARRDYRLDERQEESEGVPAAAVKGSVSFLRTHRSVLVSANLSVTSSDVCSRCLEPLESSYEIEFHEEFAPTLDPATGLHLVPPNETLPIDEDQSLDLDEAIRQYRIASQSMQPLCRPDCKGLCPECGANLNEGPCSCSLPASNVNRQALAALHEIRAQLDHEGKG